jgi:hypothetical protein
VHADSQRQDGCAVPCCAIGGPSSAER